MIDSTGADALPLPEVGVTSCASGAGTLTLSGTNTYSGTTTITEGILQIGAGGTTGAAGFAAGAAFSSGAFWQPAINRVSTTPISQDARGAGVILFKTLSRCNRLQKSTKQTRLPHVFQSLPKHQSSLHSSLF